MSDDKRAHVSWAPNYGQRQDDSINRGLEMISGEPRDFMRAGQKASDRVHGAWIEAASEMMGVELDFTLGPEDVMQILREFFENQ
jgi:hypothetical protein